MSRTFRHIPFHYRTVMPWEKTWIGLDPNLLADWLFDPRDKWMNGYDNGKGQKYYYGGYPKRGWPETYSKKTRKFFKRNFHKTRRLADKRLMMKELAEGYPSAETIGDEDGTLYATGIRHR